MCVYQSCSYQYWEVFLCKEIIVAKEQRALKPWHHSSTMGTEALDSRLPALPPNRETDPDSLTAPPALLRCESRRVSASWRENSTAVIFNPTVYFHCHCPAS